MVLQESEHCIKLLVHYTWGVTEEHCIKLLVHHTWGATGEHCIKLLVHHTWGATGEHSIKLLVHHTWVHCGVKKFPHIDEWNMVEKNRCLVKISVCYRNLSVSWNIFRRILILWGGQIIFNLSVVEVHFVFLLIFFFCILYISFKKIHCLFIL